MALEERTSLGQKHPARTRISARMHWLISPHWELMKDLMFGVLLTDYANSG